MDVLRPLVCGDKTNAPSHVRIEAVPGAGKTTSLLSIVSSEGADGPHTLVLAYNRQLAASICARLDREPDDVRRRVTCLTFHSLCSRCVAVARDDVEMLAAVEAAENGEVEVHDVPPATRLVIDEAQDVREPFVRLLRVLGYLRGDTQLVVAGDRNQVVYDFDPDFPASLDVLEGKIRKKKEKWGEEWREEQGNEEGEGNKEINEQAELNDLFLTNDSPSTNDLFPSTNHSISSSSSSPPSPFFPFQLVTLDVSHRLTPHIATFVNSVFGTSISSARTSPSFSSHPLASTSSSKPFPRVDVRAPSSMWTLGVLLRDVLEEDDVLVLVREKQGNTPLKKLINGLSRAGRHSIHVHGAVEGIVPSGNTTTNSSASAPFGNPTNGNTSISSTSAPSKKLTCGTYWSAKGLECRTCIVIVPGRAPRNPTYVALTRACHRLVVVLDPKAPHPEVCAAVHASPGAVEVRDRFTASVVVAGATAFDKEGKEGGGKEGGKKEAGGKDGKIDIQRKEMTEERNASKDKTNATDSFSSAPPSPPSPSAPPSPSSSSGFGDFGPRDKWQSALAGVTHWRDVERWRPSGTSVRDLVKREDLPAPPLTHLFGAGQKSRNYFISSSPPNEEVVVRMALVAAELESSGRVRAVEDIAHPTRLERDSHAGAIGAGHAGRFAPMFTSDTELLADDLRKMCMDAYARLTKAKKRASIGGEKNSSIGGEKNSSINTPLNTPSNTPSNSSPLVPSAETLADVATLALSVLSWDAWDHTMRSLLPCAAWCTSAAPAVAFVSQVIASLQREEDEKRKREGEKKEDDRKRKHDELSETNGTKEEVRGGGTPASNVSISSNPSSLQFQNDLQLRAYGSYSRVLQREEEEKRKREGDKKEDDRKRKHDELNGTNGTKEEARGGGTPASNVSISSNSPPPFQFDLRLRAHGCYSRVHASSAAACVHVVWDASASDLGRAAVLAALHPARRCVLVEVGGLYHDLETQRSGRVTDVRVKDAEKLLTQECRSV